MQDEKLNDFFNRLNQFFDHIYVITLKRATDRHQHIERELNGLNYQLFFGKDKQEFSVDDLRNANVYNEDLAKKRHRYNKPMQPGQLGCAWSHAEVYADVIAKEYNRVLILEDDVVINKKYTYLLAGVLESLPPDWELLYFGFAERETEPKLSFFKIGFYHFLSTIGLLRFSHKTIKNFYPKKISEHIYTAGYHDCTHAYGITLETAEKLLQLQQPISFVADNLLAYACTNKLVNGYIILPKLINQLYQEGTNSRSYLNQ